MYFEGENPCDEQAINNKNVILKDDNKVRLEIENRSAIE